MLEPLSIFICFLTWTIGLGALIFPWNKRSTLCDKIRGSWVVGFVILLTIILLWNRFWGVGLLPYFITPLSLAGIIILFFSCLKTKLKIKKEDLLWLAVIIITVMIGMIPILVESGYVGTQDCGDAVFSIKPAMKIIDCPIETVKKYIPEVKLRFLSRSLLATVASATFQSPVITFYPLMLILFATLINAVWHCGRKWLRYPLPVIAIAAFWISVHSGLHWVDQSQFLPHRCGEIIFLIAMFAWLASLQVRSIKLVLLSAVSMALLFITFRVLFLPGLLIFLIISIISVLVNKSKRHLLWIVKIFLLSCFIGFLVSFPDTYEFIKEFFSKYLGHYKAVANNTSSGNFKQFLFPIDASGLLLGLRWMPYPFDSLNVFTAAIEKMIIVVWMTILAFALFSYNRKVIRWGMNIIILSLGSIILYTIYIHYNYALMKSVLLLVLYICIFITAYLWRIWKMNKTTLATKAFLFSAILLLLLFVAISSYCQIKYSISNRLNFGYKAYQQIKGKDFSTNTYFAHLWDGERQAEIMLRWLLFNNIFSNTYQVSGYNWKNTLESTNTIIISHHNPYDIIPYSEDTMVDVYGLEVSRKYGNLLFSKVNKFGNPETDTLCFDNGWLYLFSQKRQMKNNASLRFYSIKGGKYKLLLDGYIIVDAKKIIFTVKLNGKKVFEKNLPQNVIINDELEIMPGWNKIEFSINGKNIPDNALKVTKIEITHN
ncbi:hypothetical protein KAH27_06175 [bacterium]|nr:hypothetical protein [bacterium]